MNLADPKMMDVAVPANLRIGLTQENLRQRGLAVDADEFKNNIDHDTIVLIDLRDQTERDKHGMIAGSVHAPYPKLDEQLAAGGLLSEFAKSTDKTLVFYCAYGERSAMAVEAARAAGIEDVRHLHGGIDAWHDIAGELVN